MQELQSPVEHPEGLRRAQMLANASRALPAHQRHVELGHHLVRYFVLDGEDVLQVAVIALGPDVSAGRSLHEPGRDA